MDSHCLIGFIFLWLNPFGHGRGVLCSAHGSSFDKETQSQPLGALYRVKLPGIEGKKSNGLKLQLNNSRGQRLRLNDENGPENNVDRKADTPHYAKSRNTLMANRLNIRKNSATN